VDAGAGTHDAGTDASHAPIVAGLLPNFLDGWVQAPWATDCEIYEPASPATLVTIPPLQWTPCASGRSNCVELAKTWSPASSDTFGWSIGKSPTGATRAAFSRTYVVDTASTLYQEEYAIWDSDEGFVAAWRHQGDDSCLALGVGDVTAGSATLSVAAQGPPQQVQRYFQIVGAGADLLTRTTPDYTFCDVDLGFAACPSPLLMSSTAASPHLVVMGYDQASRIFIRDRGTGRIDLLRPDGGTNASARTIWGNYSVADDAVFYSDGKTGYVWKLGVGERILVAPAAGVAAHDVAADGSYVAWVESSNPDSNGDFTSSTLYGSPYTTDAAGLQRRVLLDSVCPTAWCEVRVEEGYVLVSTWMNSATPSKSIVVIRMSDGQRWTMPAEPGDRWETGFESNGEIWLPYSNSNQGAQFSLRRVALSALGGDP
jgi:hypothetical protein